MRRQQCRYCPQEIGLIKVNGLEKAVTLVPIPYREGTRGYILSRSQGWRRANDVHPAPTEVLPPHPCAYVEQMSGPQLVGDLLDVVLEEIELNEERWTA